MNLNFIYRNNIASHTFAKQGQHTSGQKDGTQVKHALPRLHRPQQNVDSICTSSPLPPQQNVRQELQYLVSFLTLKQ